MAEGTSACIDCGAVILASTAARLEGLCAQCAKQSPGARAQNRDFLKRLRTSEVFLPSPPELGSARDSDALLRPRRSWRIDDTDTDLVPSPSTLRPFLELPSGQLFLVSDAHERLSLVFGPSFAVLEYHLETGDDRRYAYTDLNARAQIDRVSQLDQSCPCCGVGMFWYPSRFHMPRSLAFELLLHATTGQAPRIAYKWLEYDDDITHASPGRG